MDYWRRIFPLVGALALLAALWGCKEDEDLAPEPPDSWIFLDRIELAGENRLTTRVELHWRGEDKDGAVAGYEFSTDNASWTYTTRTDSVFNFVIPVGSDTTDVQFYVRAVDDDQLRDPSPAFLRVPIKNTAPTARFDSTFVIADTTLPALTFRIEYDDLDGFETLDRIEIRANDAPWTPVRKGANLVSLLAVTPEQTGDASAEIYLETDASAWSERLPGLRIGEQNTLYVRAVDQAGLASAIDTSATFYLRPKSSDLLVIDGWRVLPRPIGTYRPILESLYGGFDYLDLTIDKNQPTAGSITWRLLMRMYPEVFWYAQPTGVQLELVERAESAILEHLRGNRKLLMCAPLRANLESSSPFFTFSPMDSLSTTASGGLMNNDARLNPIEAPDYPVLKNGSGAFISGVTPFYRKAGAQPIYEAELQLPTGEAWPAGVTRLVAARLRNAQGNANHVFCVAPLHLLNGDGNLEAFFREVKQNFDW